MLNYIQGKLAEVAPTVITVDVRGVGYALMVPISTSERLPPLESPVTIFTHLHLRDDNIQLYGFLTKEERELFRGLIGVTGIGPKVALTVLSGITIENFKKAVSTGNIGLLSSIPGIGKKTAERLVLELKGKIGTSTFLKGKSTKVHLSAEQQHLNDALLALISLGYKELSAQRALTSVIAELGDETTVRMSAEELVRKALKYI